MFTSLLVLSVLVSVTGCAAWSRSAGSPAERIAAEIHTQAEVMLTIATVATADNPPTITLEAVLSDVDDTLIDMNAAASDLPESAPHRETLLRLVDTSTWAATRLRTALTEQDADTIRSLEDTLNSIATEAESV